MTDKCPKCSELQLVFDERIGLARCLAQGCGFEQRLGRAEYLQQYADKSRMVVLPKELGSKIADPFKAFVSKCML